MIDVCCLFPQYLFHIYSFLGNKKYVGLEGKSEREVAYSALFNMLQLQREEITEKVYDIFSVLPVLIKARYFNYPPLTELQQAELDYALACISNYHLLNSMGMAYFEEDGTVKTEDKDGIYIRPGRTHITRIINLFKSKDDPKFYMMCARCKELLDEYDAKFKQ